MKTLLFLLFSGHILHSAACAANPEEIQALFAKDEPKSARQLIELGDETVPFLAGVMRDPKTHPKDWGSRAASVLGRIGTPLALAEIRKLAVDKNGTVRGHAIEILCKQRTERKENLAVLRGRMETEDDPRNLEKIIEEIADERAPEDLPLFKKLNAKEQGLHVQLAIWYALAQQGEKNALLEIVKVCEKHTGHFGVIFLRRITQQDFGWNMPAWRKWIAATPDEEFKKLVAPPNLAPAAPGPGPNRPAQELPHELTPEVQEAVVWFDSLGLPSIKDLTRVRVTDESSSEKEKQKSVESITGWVLEEKEGNWRILAGTEVKAPFTPDSDTPWPLREWTPKESDKTENGWRTVRRIAKIDFKEEAEKTLTDLDAEKVPHQWPERFGMVLSERASIFLMGRACLDRGLTDTGVKLLQRAPLMGRGVNDHRAFSLALAEEFALCAFWKVTLDFGVPEITRETILADLETAQKRFPSTERAKGMKAMADLLRKMIEEDREHARTVKPFDTMTPEEQAAELVFQLRNQNGHQFSQPGGCDIFSGSDKSPAVRLVKMGHAAIPALIKALESDRYSRSVGFWRNFRFSHHVLTVGDCALQTLERIANRSFYVRRTTSSYMSSEELAAATRKEVEAWWGEIKGKGERQVLIDAVAAGDDNSVSQAAVLIERFPDAAAGALLAGAGKAKSDWNRSQLIALMPRVKNDRITDFLRGEMRDGPLFDARLEAIRAILAIDRKAAAAALETEWNRMPSPARRNEGEYEMTQKLISDAGEFDAGESRSQAEKLLQLIYLSGEPGPIQAVSSTFSDKPLWTQAVIISAASREELEREQTPEKFSTPPANEKAAIESAIESVLFVALEEKEARLCEEAARMLHERWPDKYKFEDVESRRGNDAQILAIKNVRRAAEGKPALTAPAPVTIARAEQKKADPLLKAVGEAGSAEAIDAAIGKMAAELGLSVLPWAAERLNALPKDSPERARWEKAAQVLACVVRDVTVDSKAPHLTQCRELQDIKGKALTPQSLERLLVALYRATPKDVAGFTLSAYRDDHGTGFVLTVSARKEKSSGSDDWWSLFYAGNQFQAVGADNRGYYGTADIGDSKDDFVKLRDAFEQATADWKRPAYLGYQVTRQRR